MNSRIKRVTHVIFDMDGVLLDTEPLYTVAIQNVVGKYGKVYDWSVKSHILGLQGIEAPRKIVELLDLPISPEELYELNKIQYNIVMKDAQVISETAKVVEHLHKHNIPIAVATSSYEEIFHVKTAKHKDFFTLFNHIVCGGSDPEVKKGKPSPDIFLTCASRFPDKPLPENCLVVEDAPNGVAAAIAAGMQVIMIPDDNLSAELRKDAHLIVNSLDQAPLDLFGLPPFIS
ncbi:pseudouridine-5'-phosphatase [Anoplophora glabripennis]|uniref:pseudouridine-5'-phosphatase n=1 Tax=Anoplophora glabripennis TaxID=217634 RepID=UPI0008755130|nr:pseudouridine-5'-phosphatase [Anoplophora glabripennis]